MSDAKRYSYWKLWGLCVNCGRNRDTKGVRCARCRGHHGNTPDLRAKILDVYGRVCKCCGETTELFLTFDHVNNDGATQRKTLTSSNSLMYWIIRNNYPDSIQVLCYNCNCGRARNNGICPHKFGEEAR